MDIFINIREVIAEKTNKPITQQYYMRPLNYKPLIQVSQTNQTNIYNRGWSLLNTTQKINRLIMYCNNTIPKTSEKERLLLVSMITKLKIVYSEESGKILSIKNEK